MLLYGGAAAILVSALEGVAATLIISKRPRTILFNSAILATSTFFTATVLNLIFGPPAMIVHRRQIFSRRFFNAICLMAFVQYIANTTLIAIEKASKIKESAWNTWRTYYLWTSVTYFAGASAAGIIAILIKTYSFYAVIATVPIILIICFTYQTYLKNIEASLEQTEAARLHVQELSRYVSELQRSEEAREQLLLRAERARAEAEAANRIKDEFLATLSHELRTPLTSLLGWSSVLREAKRDEKVLHQGLEAIDRNARIQAQLIDDLLDVSRIVSGKLNLEVRPLDIASVARAAINVVRPAADAKGITLDYSDEPGLGAISADSATSAPDHLEPVIKRGEVHSTRRQDLCASGPRWLRCACDRARYGAGNRGGISAASIRSISAGGQFHHAEFWRVRTWAWRLFVTSLSFMAGQFRRRAMA